MPARPVGMVEQPVKTTTAIPPKSRCRNLKADIILLLALEALLGDLQSPWQERWTRKSPHL
jgi:hypothetical protein